MATGAARLHFRVMGKKRNGRQARPRGGAKLVMTGKPPGAGQAPRKSGAAKSAGQIDLRRGDPSRAKGALFIIGGREDKQNDKLIMRTLARRIGAGTLVISTLATSYEEEVWQEYRELFAGLGVKHIEHLTIDQREDSESDPRIELLDRATCLFFTGGDQLKITTRLGGTPLCAHIEELFRRGGIIAGTSAGASVMGEAMIVAGHAEETHKVGEALLIAPGLGLLKDVIVDQHFSERGRIGRLLGAVAQNPRLVGLGIDEDTAIVCEGNDHFQVLGSGAVYVLDGRTLTHTNIAEEDTDRALSVFGVKLHVLSQSDKFDLKTHQPLSLPAEQVERELEKKGASKQARV
jgi:cyanophycinase